MCILWEEIGNKTSFLAQNWAASCARSAVGQTAGHADNGSAVKVLRYLQAHPWDTVRHLRMRQGNAARINALCTPISCIRWNEN